MVVTTRSKSRTTKKADTSKEADTNSRATKVIAKKDWTTNWAVMDEAIKIFRLEVFSEKHKENKELTSNRVGFEYAAKREWESMPDSEKAPFITKALEQMVRIAVLWARVYKKTNSKGEITKLSKRNEKQLIASFKSQARDIFLREVVYVEFFRAHPDKNNIPVEVFKAGETRRWIEMADTEKDVYVDIVKKRWADSEEVYAHLLVDEAYKHIRDNCY